ncbi:MAG: DUF4476 domain-containing protein [Bacteroidales bacterium]|nr:DUF4476 domain-containing protein [Bacteroidales bacterium]
MKKNLLILSIFLIIALNGFSQSASLTIFSQDGEKFWVIMNGIRQNQTPSTNVVVTGLTENNYRVKIIFEDEAIAAIDKNISPVGVDGLYSQTQVIRKDRKGKYVLKMSSFEEVSAAQPAGNSSQVFVPYTTQERPVATQTVTTTQTNETIQTSGVVQTNISADDDRASTGVTIRDPETGEVINVDVDMGVNGIGMDMKTPEGDVGVNMNVDMRDNSGRVTTTTTTTTSVTTSTAVDSRDWDEMPPVNQPPTYVLPGYNGPVGCPMPMSDADFNMAKNTISSKTFEDSKLTIAKQITSSNCLLSRQVKEIMSLFSFEDSKLTFAKHAYTYTFDIGNYYIVNDAFTFEMTIDELNEFISNQRR